MYRYTGNEEALKIAIQFSRWFYDYTADKSRKELDNILDFETGGMLEIWADLYEFVSQLSKEAREEKYQESEVCASLSCASFEEMYMTLIERYDRHRLFDPLLEGLDVLTNMHANTTIPEVLGAAKIYEVTGIERYKKVAEKYWECAVTQRGSFVTGGQTCGEIWTPQAVEVDSETEFTLHLRKPEWVKKEVLLYINDMPCSTDVDEQGYITLKRCWKNGDVVKLLLPLSIYTTALPGEEDMVAFSYGPMVLAGLCDAERILFTRGKQPEQLLIHDNEREWGFWKDTFKTKLQDPGIRFIPLNQVGYERYQVYFPIIDQATK